MRTQEQIAEKMRESKSIFGFDRDVYSNFLDIEHGAEFFNEEFMAKVKAGEEKCPCSEFTRENVLKEMREYMEFAWGKVEDHRGISAGRSVEKIQAHAWLLGDDDVVTAMEQEDYAQYGAPCLAIACHKYDLPIPDDDRIQRMIEGLQCNPEGCYEGCG